MELFLSGLLCVGSILNLWFFIIPSGRVAWFLNRNRGACPTPFKDRESWVIYANTQLGSLGQLLTCPTCLALHASFWGALILQLHVPPTYTLTQRCGLFLTCVLGWSLCASLVFRLRQPTADVSNPTEKAAEPTQTKDTLTARLDFLKSRGTDAEATPDGRILVKSTQPIHQKLQNLTRLDGSQDCFFDGCGAILQPLIDKKKAVDGSTCPRCELGPVLNKVYQDLVTHLKESGIYDSLNK